MGSVGQESVEPRVTQQPKAAVSGIPLTRRNARNLALTGASALWPRNAQLLLRNARATLGTEPWRDFLKGDRGPARLDALADAALGWIRRSQDRVGSGGVGDRTFHGWTPGYPEVTGYIIPTFWDYHELRGSDDLAQRALRMAEWELRLQKSEGGFESLYEGEGQPAVVFNTGQVIRGLTRTYLETREDRFLDAAMRAADWIVANQEPDGSWTKANYLGMKRTYDVYAAAGLAELATVASEDRYAVTTGRRATRRPRRTRSATRSTASSRPARRWARTSSSPRPSAPRPRCWKRSTRAGASRAGSTTPGGRPRATWSSRARRSSASSS
jgi:hypothetical protein